MKQRILAMMLSMAMVFSMIPASLARAEEAKAADAAETVESTGEDGNLAASAEASAAHTNTYGIKLASINDGKLAGADPTTSWNCWGAADNLYPMPVTLTWKEEQTIASMRVMWWSDGGGSGVAFPSAAEVQYQDGEEWKKIADAGLLHGGFNGEGGVWNIVNFSAPVKTTAIRLLVSKESGGGIGISEWEVYGTPLQNSILGASIEGSNKLKVGETADYTGSGQPADAAEGASYQWSIEPASDVIKIDQEGADSKKVKVTALKTGKANLRLTVTKDDVSKTADYAIRVILNEVSSIDPYQTSTSAGKAPILPDSVVANGLEFDDPTPSEKSSTTGYDFGEEFNSKLIPVKWEAIDPSAYDAAKTGKTFTVNGTASYDGKDYPAQAIVSVKAPVAAATSNSSVTFENVQLNDEFWMPRQEINATASLDKAILEIEKSTGGEPNFDNAIKKLNGEPYKEFQGFVFQDSDIYKSIEAISYTLSATQNDTGAQIVAQRKKLQDKLDSWISKIEKVQYADGYIDTHFTLRSRSYSGGGRPGTHRWIELSNHEMYNAGHLLEGVVAYTRYREGIGQPDYRLYVVGRRFANEIASLFGPNGTRHEVPGHEEVELALVKFGKLAEEYEGEGAGKIYYDTAKVLIDRRGEDRNLRDSGYKGGEYSQDAIAFKDEANAVGHAVRANYFYYRRNGYRSNASRRRSG